jgi:hypothetical protein
MSTTSTSSSYSPYYNPSMKQLGGTHICGHQMCMGMGMCKMKRKRRTTTRRRKRGGTHIKSHHYKMMGGRRKRRKTMKKRRR